MNAGCVGVIFAILSLVVVTPQSAQSCPLDFSVLNGYSSALKAACDGGDMNVTACCQAASSGLELSLAKYLDDTGLFLLQNATQARLCLRRIRAQIQMIGVLREVVNDCFERQPDATNGYRASFLHWMPQLCQGIQSTHDFQRIAGASVELITSCRANLEDPSACTKCATDMRRVEAHLVAMNGATAIAECANFVRMYVVANVSVADPWDSDTAFCIFALAHDAGVASRKHVYIGIGLGATGLMSVGMGIFLWAWWRWRDGAIHREFLRRNNRMLSYHSSLVWYDWAAVKAATGGFSHGALLGEGGYGCVYKGVLRDGSTVAVKQFKNCAPEGDLGFLNEVEALSKLRHRNLVNLLGCCIASSKRFGHQRILVYDYMPNRSLADYLFGEANPLLTWEQRRHIAVGVAQGLAYLHVDARPQVIHRDIKASNVLLDGQLNAAIADFGLAKFACVNDSFPLTSHIKGTLGYVAPEYALYGQLTEKTDVYSFGVCLLELLSGRPALAETWGSQETSSNGASPDCLNSNYLITDWAWSQLVVNKRPLEIIDARIRGSGDVRSQTRAVMTRFVMVGMLCAHVMVSMRPSMADALRMLEGHCEVPVNRIFERPALPLSHEAGDYVISLGRYNALEIDVPGR